MRHHGRGPVHDVPTGESEDILPGCVIGGAGSAKADYSSRRIVVVIVAESGLVKVEDGVRSRGAGGAFAQGGYRQRGHRAQIRSIGFDKNCGKRRWGSGDEGAIATDHEGRAV